MDLSKVKLIATDMDGTLLNANHQVSKLFFEQFESLKKHGIIFVAASGRPYYSIIEKLNTIKDDIVVIGENGAITIQKDEELLFTPLTVVQLASIISHTSKLEGITPILCAREAAYITKESEWIIDTLKEFYTNIITVDNLNEVKQDIIKVAIFHPESTEKYIYPKVKALEDEMTVKVSGQQWLDFSHPLANKGHALSQLQKRFNIKPEETLAFGDFNNDIEMLEKAHFSFAMENAHANVKKVANFETKSNLNQGVEYIIDKVIAAKKN